MQDSAVHEVERGAFVWCAAVPWLPDVGIDADRVDAATLYVGYEGLMEALAAATPASRSVQVRLLADGSPAGIPCPVRPYVLGRATARDEATRLWSLVQSTIPAEIPLQLLGSRSEVERVLSHAVGDDRDPFDVVEVRRRIEDVATYPAAALEESRLLPAVLRWAPNFHGLRHAVTVLARHPTAAVLALHVEPARPSAWVLEHCSSLIREIVADQDMAATPLRTQVAQEYRQRLRDLPRASLEVRVALSAAGRVAPGLAESVGFALAAQGSFALSRPLGERQYALALDLFTSLRARWWAPSDRDDVDELTRLVDTREAAAVVRLPLPLRGGSPGMVSAPVATLPRGAQAEESGTDGITLGDAVGGGAAHLSRTEVNQHVLVAGLPGFGKTLTVQTILARLASQPHHLPFLVLDPAKSDYENLTSALSMRGTDVRHIRLTPDAPVFNPLGVPEGCSPQGHAGRVLAAFDAAFGMSTHFPLGYVTFARALFATYEAVPSGSSPSLRQLRRQVENVIEGTGFTGPDGANLRASLVGRVDYLSHGPLGRAFHGTGSAHSIDFAELLSQPTIVEMREFAGPAERSLLFALIVAGLISYRERHPIPGGLGHVTVLEEAHRVLGNTAGSANEGVRLLVEAIAEMRGSGEGFVIVDQAPTLLHPGVLKLCGSILAHRLVDPQERLIVGSAVLLDARQQSDLARLAPGQAVLHSSSRATPTVVGVEVHPDVWAATKVSDGAVNHFLPHPPWLPGIAGEEHAAPATLTDPAQLVHHFASQGLGALDTRESVTRVLIRNYSGDEEELVAQLAAMNEALVREKKARQP